MPAGPGPVRKLVMTARDLARKEGVAPDGYRCAQYQPRGGTIGVALHFHLIWEDAFLAGLPG